MDQTTSPNQGLLWDFGECRKDSDLDCHQRLCPGCHRQEEAQSEGEPLYHVTDLERVSFLENTIIPIAFAN
jgi:hypothetical protein